MQIIDYLKPEHILFTDTADSKSAVLRQLAQVLAETGAVGEIEACHLALLERENLMTTGVGKGVALPHAFHPSVQDSIIAYVHLRRGIDYDAVDNQPVRHVFCILGPPSAQGRHLKILARLARLLNHDEFVAALDQATDAAAFLEAFQVQEENLTSPPAS